MLKTISAYISKKHSANRIASELRALDNRELDDLGVSRRNIALIANLSAAR